QSLREIRYKENFLQSLVDANPDGIRVIDEDYRIVLANKSYADNHNSLIGDVVGSTCYASSHQRDTPCIPTLVTCPLDHIKQASQPVKTIHEHHTGNGKLTAVEIYAAPMEIKLNGKKRLMLVESIRDLEKAVQVSHEQKLSEIGELAAGVAHEIHNPLASVRIALDSVMRIPASERAQTADKIFDCMSLVDKEIDRCIEVTERLLKMSMFAGGETQIVAINDAVSDTLSLLSWEAGEMGVTIETRLNEESPRILANESDIRMVILNIAQNAFHAMPEGGLLRVRTERADGRVELIFEDTGHGISPADLPKIFNPFYSHRADGVHGTGLGLAITKSLVKRYKGSIDVFSTINRGSRFTIRFPDPDYSKEETGP
ncbi:MAG TPA: PAS domain-containing protein, partial [Chromatiales bacterium]|nr:PAS domain-containing protein [Chromatiales bacterium]